MILVMDAVEHILDCGPTEVEMHEKTANFSSIFDIFSQFFDCVHDQVLSDLGVKNLQTEDDFFDYFMTFFEKVNHLKPRLKKYLFRVLKAPAFYSDHIKTFQYAAYKLKIILPQMPKSYYHTTLAILPAVLYVWLQDESDDLCHTMKKLQQVSCSFSSLISDG